MLRIIKTEPALITGLVQSVLALVVGLGWNLTGGQTGALLTATTAVLALVAAASTKPFHVAVLTGALSSIATALIAFGIPHITTGGVASVNTIIVALAALLLRAHVTPKAAPARM